MKRRRPCTRNQTRSPVNSPRAIINSVTADIKFLRSKSYKDLKRLQRENDANKKQKRHKDNIDRGKLIGAKKKDICGSLESLFDVKKPLRLPEVPFYFSPENQLNDYSSSESDSFKNPRPLIVNYFGESKSLGQEPDIRADAEEFSELCHRREISKLEELEFDIFEDNPTRSDVDDISQSETRSLEDMDDDPDENAATEVEDDDDNEEEAPEPSAPPEEETANAFPVPEDKSLEIIEEAKIDDGDDADRIPKPPEYPLPPGVGEGIPMKPGSHRDSVLSTTPLTDSEVIREMIDAEERCKIVEQEIQETKAQINELKHKEDLSEEDTRMLQEKQASLLTKIQEFDAITRNIQRIVGLADPSSRTFAKMFETLPYPHTKTTILEEDEETKDKELEPKDDKIITEKTEKDYDDDDDHFELPQPEYPEDKLPRAIVCGFTEDRIPKIVIPDSRPKGTRCLKNLTGKLSESLNMQERLVHENAKLEGGRYKLEEALLEKDNTLDSLQRKVCGLQAEMRIVLKENTDLNRQLASFGNNQRSADSPACCFTCPADNSPRSTNRQQSSFSYGSSPRRDDESCHCERCLREQYDSKIREGSTFSANPEDQNIYQKSCSTTPRLSGGGSREGGCFFPTATNERGPTMACRGPANVQIPASSGRFVPCPAGMENQPSNYGNSTKQLAQQLDSMESEVRNMQMELANVHRERQQLEQQRKLLKCTGPCAPCSCCPPPGMPQSSASIHQSMMVPCITGAPSSAIPQTISTIPEATMNLPASMQQKMGQQQEALSCSGICVDAPMGASNCPPQQLRDLREQYARLQEDYRNKLCEVSCLRTDAEKMKLETREAKEEREKAENRLVDLQERLRSMESDKLKFRGGKEQMVEQEQTLLVAKQRYREAQDELEELRSLIQDQANQLEDYRNKYLQAQETVEEQRRQLDLMEMDNARMNENVNLEIGRVKNQFKEKLAELAPLPDILKQTQAKLQEVQQMRLIAERNCEDLSRELLTCKDKLGMLSGQLNAIKSENLSLHDEKGMGSGRCEELEKKNSELKTENERMKNSIARFEEHEAQLQQRFDEKLHEIVQLTAMLEQVREDSARQVARTKERCETVRRTMQGQIGEMEKQLAQCRATARAAQKDRDEIRQKMQGQINDLMGAFDQAQGRIRSLQGHVNYLKTSYSNIFSPIGQGEPPVGYVPNETAGQGQGYDSCDCNY